MKDIRTSAIIRIMCVQYILNTLCSTMGDIMINVGLLKIPCICIVISSLGTDHSTQDVPVAVNTLLSLKISSTVLKIPPHGIEYITRGDSTFPKFKMFVRHVRIHIQLNILFCFVVVLEFYYRVSQKNVSCLMKHKIETRCPIIEIQLFPERKFSHLDCAS